MKVGCCALVRKPYPNHGQKILGIDCVEGRGLILPGGKWEPRKETYIQCAARELNKQTHLTAFSGRIVYESVNINGCWNMVYEMVTTDVNFVTMTSGDPVWITEDDLMDTKKCAFAAFFQNMFSCLRQQRNDAEGWLPVSF